MQAASLLWNNDMVTVSIPDCIAFSIVFFHGGEVSFASIDLILSPSKLENNGELIAVK